MHDGADEIFDQAHIPKFCLYSIGHIQPMDILNLLFSIPTFVDVIKIYIFYYEDAVTYIL